MRVSENAEFLHMACESNVRHTIAQIRSESPIHKGLEDDGAIYDMDNGRVNFLE